MEYKENNDTGQVNEPSPAYTPMKGMKLRIFHSFEEANAYDACEAARQAPLDRIRKTVQLILRTYGVTEEDLRKRRKKLKLEIIKRG